MANVIVLTGASDFADGDLPRILWDDKLSASTITASSTASDSDTAYLVDGRLDRAWSPASGTSHTLTFDLGAATNISGVGIHGHNIGDLPSATILAEYYDGATWQTWAASSTPTSTRTWYKGTTTVSAEQVRLTITHGATSDTLSIAAVMAGPDVICERGLQPGWADPLLSRAPVSRPNISRNGISLPGTIDDAKLDSEFSLADVSGTWAINTWQPFRRACDGAQAPAFLSWAPQTYPDHACYCTAISFGQTTWSRKGFCNVSFKARMDSETGWP